MGIYNPINPLGLLGRTSLVPSLTGGTTDAMAAQFAGGFAEGLARRLPSSLGHTIAATVRGDPVGFYIGYSGGFVTGLVGGLTSLLEALVSVAKLAEAVSIHNLARSSLKESYLLLTSATHRDLRRMQLAQAKAVALAVGAVIKDIHARPQVYVDKSRYVGVILGQELATHITEQARTASAPELGTFIGKIVGRVGFEILVVILLAIASGNAGNILRGLRVFGQASEGGAGFARLIARLEDVLEGLPALRRLIVDELKGLASTQTVAGRDVFKVVKTIAARSDLTAAQKAAMLEKVFPEITALDGWSASRGPAAGMEAMFTGQQRPFGLIVDKQGRLWQIADITKGGKFGVADGQLQYIPDLNNPAWMRVE